MDLSLVPQEQHYQEAAQSDFPGGLAENLAANAGDTGSIPASERFHMQWDN